MKNLKLIQQKLVAPKGQKNKFGNYMYRSAEDILNAVKPLLGESLLTLSDEIVEVGGRIYVKATASFIEDKEEIRISAFAREAEIKKGMDTSQITGSTSSYARKYALNGLFLIDDTKDADTMDNRKAEPKKEDPKKADPKLVLEGDALEKARVAYQKGEVTLDQIAKKYDLTNIDLSE